MNALMLIQINQIASDTGSAHGTLDNSITFSGKGDNTAVVVTVACAMQDAGAANRGNGRLQRVDPGRIAAFRKIRNALDEQVFVQREISIEFYLKPSRRRGKPWRHD